MPADASIDAIYRAESRRVLATLIRQLGDFDIAEEAMHEAFVAAVEQWPAEGVPDNPRAWLMTTARNRATDRIRRDRTLAAKRRLLEVPEATEDDVDDDGPVRRELDLLRVDDARHQQRAAHGMRRRCEDARDQDGDEQPPKHGTRARVADEVAGNGGFT